MRNRVKFPAIFGIVCGVGMLAQWTLFILTRQVPELQTEPYRIAFHLAAEGITAFGMILSGILLLRVKPAGRILYAVSAGMLLYSVIVSPGYFAQLGQWGMVGMFMVLLGGTLFSLILLFGSSLSEFSREKT